MIDVDGTVISADELRERVERLLASIEPDDGSAPPRRWAQRGHQPADQAVRDLQHLQHQVRPPDLVHLPGPRGYGAWMAKRVVRKLSAWYVEPRWELQQHFDARAADLATSVSTQLAELQEDLRTLRRQVSAQGARQSELHKLAEEVRHASVNDANLDRVHRELSGMLERLGVAAGSGAAIDYAAFEERFRGSSEEVRRAQQRYVSMFPAAGTPGRIVDVGCGRGEMLELLGQAGHDPVGVDTDETMIAACQAKGLEVVRDDGLRYLSRAEDGSLKGIFCAQVVEHLLTSEMEGLVRAAHQKLRAGGVVIFETINPRSLHALGNHFFADTSHVRPVHPETLRFICEQVGFASVQMEELSPHPMSGLAEDLPDDQAGQALRALLGSVFGFQDYFVAATR